MTREEIKNELRIRGQRLSGNKVELLDRLKKALEVNVVVRGRNCTGTNKVTKKRSDGESGLSSFPSTAYWRVLEPDEVATEEPENSTFKNARAPTIDARDAKFVPVKYGFSKYKFDIPIFNAITERVSRWANGREKKKKDGSVLKDTTMRKVGCIDPRYISKHKLNTQTRPDQYADLLLPMDINMQGGRERLSFRQMKDWTNLKASLADAGKNGLCYRDFKQFTTKEIRQHLGLYVLQGLCPSPRVEMKFQSQDQDKLHGNDFVYRSFGSNAERRHRHFKAFFSCQDPRINHPSRDEEPNWKVRPLLTWMNFYFQLFGYLLVLSLWTKRLWALRANTGIRSA